MILYWFSANFFSAFKVRNSVCRSLSAIEISDITPWKRICRTAVDRHVTFIFHYTGIEFVDMEVNKVPWYDVDIVQSNKTTQQAEIKISLRHEILTCISAFISFSFIVAIIVQWWGTICGSLVDSFTWRVIQTYFYWNRLHCYINKQQEIGDKSENVWQTVIDHNTSCNHNRISCFDSFRSSLIRNFKSLLTKLSSYKGIMS